MQPASHDGMYYQPPVTIMWLSGGGDIASSLTETAVAHLTPPPLPSLVHSVASFHFTFYSFFRLQDLSF